MLNTKNVQFQTRPSVDDSRRNSSSDEPKLTWRRILQLAKPVWFSPNRPENMRLCIIIRFLTLCCRAYLSIWITYPLKDMTTGLNTRDEAKFYEALNVFIFIVCIWCPLSATDQYMNWVVKIKWRRFLSAYLMKRYFENNNFFKLLDKPSLDNPGMRICDDVDRFTDSLLWILVTQWNQLLKVCGFTYVLLSIAPQIVPFLSIYALGGTALVVYIFAPKLAEFNMHQLIDTANFRGGLIRARENAESIAFYRAGNHEKHWSTERLYILLAHLKQLAGWDAMTKFVLYAFTWIAEGAPYVILAPPYFRKEIEFGIIMQAEQAFNAILRGTTILLKDLNFVTQMTQTAKRILAVIDQFDKEEGKFANISGARRVKRGTDKFKALELIIEDDSEDLEAPSPRITIDDIQASLCAPKPVCPRQGSVVQHTHGNELKIDNLCLQIPNTHHKLGQNLNLNVTKGESLLIVGPSGVGKSSLLRAVCGLWPAHSGKIQMPEQENLMFLPQNAYIPQIPLEQNTLKAQLLFPRAFAENTDEEMNATLKSVNLAHLMTEERGLYTCQDWRKQLSGGEKQRLAMARLLLAQPKMAFLDESTSALDDANEALLYNTLQKDKASYVSVGHRKELVKYHSHILELSPGGKWELRPSPQYTGDKTEL